MVVKLGGVVAISHGERVLNSVLVLTALGV